MVQLVLKEACMSAPIRIRKSPERSFGVDDPKLAYALAKAIEADLVRVWAAALMGKPTNMEIIVDLLEASKDAHDAFTEEGRICEGCERLISGNDPEDYPEELNFCGPCWRGAMEERRSCL